MLGGHERHQYAQETAEDSFALLYLVIDNGEKDDAKSGAHKARYGGGGKAVTPAAAAKPKSRESIDRDTAGRFLVYDFLKRLPREGVFTCWPHEDPECVRGTSIVHDPTHPPANIVGISREVVYKGFVLTTMKVVRNFMIPHVGRAPGALARSQRATDCIRPGQFVLASGPRKETLEEHAQPGETMGVTMDELWWSPHVGEEERPPVLLRVPHVQHPNKHRLVQETVMENAPSRDPTGATLMQAVLGVAAFLAQRGRGYLLGLFGEVVHPRRLGDWRQRQE
jgi:hypothetical protein